MSKSYLAIAALLACMSCTQDTNDKGKEPIKKQGSMSIIDPSCDLTRSAYEHVYGYSDHLALQFIPNGDDKNEITYFERHKWHHGFVLTLIYKPLSTNESRRNSCTYHTAVID